MYTFVDERQSVVSMLVDEDELPPELRFVVGLVLGSVPEWEEILPDAECAMGLVNGCRGWKLVWGPIRGNTVIGKRVEEGHKGRKEMRQERVRGESKEERRK